MRGWRVEDAGRRIEDARAVFRVAPVEAATALRSIHVRADNAVDEPTAGEEAQTYGVNHARVATQHAPRGDCTGRARDSEGTARPGVRGREGVGMRQSARASRQRHDGAQDKGECGGAFTRVSRPRMVWPAGDDAMLGPTT